MGYTAEFKGWDNLNLSDMLVAYRKAKADNFFENSFPSSLKFATYEVNLIENLEQLLRELQSNNGFETNERLLGEPRLMPKKMTFDSNTGQIKEHIHFSDPAREFESIKSHNKLKTEYRVFGDFPVNTHIISALWINMIGCKFDAVLSNAVYGARLRRFRNNDDNKLKSFHIKAIGSFEPYFYRYQKWRKDGLKAIRDNLHNKSVIAASLDLDNFFHNIDPEFFSSESFLKEIFGENLIKLSEYEGQFNLQMSKFLKRWSDKAGSYLNNISFNGGLALGLTVSRIISNIILYKLDKLIHEKITPIHYGRYVDDLFLVILDPGNVTSIDKLMEYLKNKIGENYVTNKDKKWKIELGSEYQKTSQLQFQTNKQKLFILEGQSGYDLLDSIEKEIIELSSEHRLMPMPDQLDETTSAKVLSASNSTREHPDSLHRADGLTIRRLSWSLQLSHFELLARDLPSNVWKKERKEFFQFVKNHIIRTDKIFEFYNHLPRILGFAVKQGELEVALDIINCTFKCFEIPDDIDKIDIKINGDEITSQSKSVVYNEIQKSLSEAYLEAIIKYLDISKYYNKKKELKFSQKDEKIINNILKKINFSGLNIDIFSESKKMLRFDLAVTPYKEFLSKSYAGEFLQKINSDKEKIIFSEFEKANLLDVEDLKEFLTNRQNVIHNVDIYSPYIFPTRPFTPEEIASISPECIWSSELGEISPKSIWSKYVQVLRGVCVKPDLYAGRSSGEKRIIKVGSLLKDKVVVAITSLYTSDQDLAYSSCGKPSLTLDRYKRISKLINKAIQLTPKPDYLIFPELSIPIDWIPSISNRLLKSGISLIAGTEYREKKGNKIFSEACLCLIDNSLGYTASLRIWQPKLNPAVDEEFKLISKYGKSWWYDNKIKPIYNHNNFYFGVMVCSELQNSKSRINYQGKIDALMVLSWNKDINTFSSLIESSALDIHAYIVMANNRKYGDSRIRVPSKQEFKRDLVRLKGGENDFLVSAELDIDALRAFQSRAKRWSSDDDPFKPVPEGFDISQGRRKKPPK